MIETIVSFVVILYLVEYLQTFFVVILSFSGLEGLVGVSDLESAADKNAIIGQFLPILLIF